MGRVFKIGTTQIADDDSTAGMTIDQVREHLKPSFPEVAEATIREKTEGEITFYEFLPRPGRKG